MYNPYYTLVCQELCRFSHSYRITLQFCLWDFLRELGESNVGGVELLKRQDELGFSSQGKSINRFRLRNTARAYSWWVAKDCCSLTIFKVSIPAAQHLSYPLTKSIACRLFDPQGSDQKLLQGILITTLYRYPDLNTFCDGERTIHRSETHITEQRFFGGRFPESECPRGTQSRAPLFHQPCVQERNGGG